LKSLGHIFTELSALVHFGTRMNTEVMGSKGQSFKVTTEFNMLENALFALLARYLEKLLY